jgi:hypothetical protein
MCDTYATGAVAHMRGTAIFNDLFAFGLATALAAQPALAASEAAMVTPGDSSATVKVTIMATSIIGSSTDDDTRTMATTGTASAAFLPDAPLFSATQFNALQLNFANTTFVFTIFFQPLNVTISNLQFTLAQPVCSPIDAGTGNVDFINTLIHATGDYTTTGIVTDSGSIDSTGASSMTGRITNPDAGTVKLDQLLLAPQTFVVDPAKLPFPLTGLTIIVEPTLTNTTLSGPFAASANSHDADADGTFDSCDTCTDSDGDGFGNPGFITNTCGLDNCPDDFNPDQSDTDNDGIGDACDVLPCPADIAGGSGGDGLVNIDDLLLVINSWGKGAGSPGDVNGSGLVNIDDLLTVINAWGACP